MRKRIKHISNIRRHLYYQQNGICPYCQECMTLPIDEFTVRKGNIATIDHIRPLSKGGSDDLKNLVASCYDCNQEKGSKLIKKKKKPSFKSFSYHTSINLPTKKDALAFPETNLFIVSPGIKPIVFSICKKRRNINVIKITPLTFTHTSDTISEDRPTAKLIPMASYGRLEDLAGNLIAMGEIGWLRLLAGERGFTL